MVDTHTHFYDPHRPEGVPWPDPKDSVLYRTVLPTDFKRLATPLGITGTLVVEASSRLEDNQWILDIAEYDPFLLGFVGNLQLDDPKFSSSLNRFSKNRLFRGIRIGGDWVRKGAGNPSVRNGLTQLSEADLSLDVLIGPDQLHQVADLGRAFPKLQIVIDHCANLKIDGEQPPGEWIDGLIACHYQPNLSMKISGLVEGSGQVNQRAPRTLDFYRRVLDSAWSAFGEDRVIFGSNWPVSERFATLETVLQLVADYAQSRNSFAAEKCFYSNAKRVYKFNPR